MAGPFRVARSRLAVVVVCAAIALAVAEPGTTMAEVYQDSGAFLEEVFAGEVPEPRLLWLQTGHRRDIRRILGHSYSAIRIRYWARDGRSAWILEEIGKYRPITTGLVVDRGAIERVKVLAYRESHGWEVRHAFFTDQFRGIRLDRSGRLTRDVDNISGATLSVRALRRLARLALYLHAAITSGDAAGAGR